jgi:ABC-2 type transport system ATP-binding protein
MKTPEAFELHNIYKHFGEVKALNGVTLKSEQGTIYGLLGPNGAGKTTIVRILSTLLAPDKGFARVCGVDVNQDPEQVRTLIGLAGQYAAVDEFQTGYENVFMTARLYGLDRKEAKRRTDELLEVLGLTDAAKRQVKTYSGGMRRRLDLGASLVGRPKVMFLDEPTTGLDPKTRLDIWKIIENLVASGTSILLTTQYLEEADQMADTIAVVDKGKVVAEGTSKQLKALLGGDIIEFKLKNEHEKSMAIKIAKQFTDKEIKYDPETLSVKVPIKSRSNDLMAIVQALNDNKLPVSSLSLHQPSLDDVFLSLTADKSDAAKGGK